MFALNTFLGDPLTREWAETRARWEPMYETTQIKGDGETHPKLSPTDEFASYERWDVGNLIGVPKKPGMLEREYIRQALTRGQAMGRLRRFAVAAGIPLLVAASAAAQDAPAGGGGSAAELAKQLANPVASLISVPFQSNWEFKVGPEEDTRYVLNFQPVLPFSLNKEWNLITRVIVPLVGQPALFPGGEPASGLSDILTSFFFSPAQPRGIIWGVGPALLVPTTSEPTLGSEKWAAGPTVLVLKQAGHWTMGALVNQIWSYAGAEDRSQVNQIFLQPFLAYNTAGGVTFTLNSEATGNWEAESGQKWTVPINFQISKIVKLGKKPMSVGLGGGYFVEKPEGGPSWKFRALVVLLFPK